ncbi:hypothetical protein [Terasakiella pusilla]|uniref:hypothetical protein n=1 Tax=Terasakiella pusilla TaxID=64973 RepID=UPI003AA7FB8E
MTDKNRRHRSSKEKKNNTAKILFSILIGALVLASLNRLLDNSVSSDTEYLKKFKIIALNTGKRLLRETLSNHFVQASQVYLLQDPKGAWSLNGSLDFPSTKISLPFYTELNQTCDEIKNEDCWLLGKVIVDGQYYSSFFEALSVSKSNANMEQLSESTFLLSKEDIEKTKQDRKIRSQFAVLKHNRHVNVSFRREMNRKYVKKTPLAPYKIKGLSYLPAKSTQGIPFKLIRGTHPVIEVIVNGNQKLNMLISTGTSRTWVPPKLFSQNPSLQEVKIDSLCLSNGFCFEEFKAISKESNYSQLIKGNYNGVIGMDLLVETGLTLDYNKKLAFFAPYESLKPRKETIKTQFTSDASNRPLAVITIGSKAYTNIILDTGSPYTRITPAMQTASGGAPQAQHSEMTHSINQIKLADIISLPEICMGGDICQKNILSEVGNGTSVGGTFFKDYVVSFDFEKEEIYLSPQRTGENYDSLKRWGLQLNIIDPSSFSWILQGSLADQKGITHTMTIVMINNTRIEDLGYINAQHLLDTHETFQLTTIDNTGEVQTFTF